MKLLPLLEGAEVVTADSVSCEEEAVEPEIVWICSWTATRALETSVIADSMEVTWVRREVFSVLVQVTEALEISFAIIEILLLEG